MRAAALVSVREELVTAAEKQSVQSQDAAAALPPEAPGGLGLLVKITTFLANGNE